ncbi:hypothetical protein HGP16_27330 [Rhizobium sp. P40RR-XXII]|uniref:hypothetical protein n=1 Tax=Rhizobium sp. P40RR-XXII TaxID=2726739 RepID=UPI001457231C|nr:hypothetical protein [Rhizobium sp. P40RR-XXII]NLS20250.1 hypothetical protein [Rhizobium sp. P40RR-XXII]
MALSKAAPVVYAAVGMQIQYLEQSVGTERLVGFPQAANSNPAGEKPLSFAGKMLRLGDEAKRRSARLEKISSVRLGGHRCSRNLQPGIPGLR